MNIDALSIGKDVPNDFNVVIEIPARAPGIKYELDKDSGAVLVDRFMSTPMHYPCNYGFVPHTLSDDGDPVDVLVVTPYPLHPGGILHMEDEAGLDAKVLAVPVSKLTSIYDNVKAVSDLPDLLPKMIEHFFEHYKDLEPNKWVKVTGWGDLEAAKKEIVDGVARYDASGEKPHF